jgi:hypothetical protein
VSIAKFRQDRLTGGGMWQFHPALGFWGVLIVIILFGMTHTAIASLGRTLTHDEALTANRIQISIPEIIEIFRHGNAVPVHYVLLKVWARFFGESEFALRSMSLLFFGLAILTMGLTGRQAIGWQGGLIAALLLSTSNRGFWYAVLARPYMLLGLQISIALFICFYFMRLTLTRPHRLAQDSMSWKDLLLFLLLVALNVSGLLNHATYIFFMCAYSFAAVLISKRTFLLLAGCSAVSLVIYLVLWGPILREQLPLPATAWMGTPDLTDLSWAFLLLWGWNSLLLLPYLVGLILCRFRSGIKVLTDKLCLVSISLIGVASLLPFAVSQFRPVFYPTRIPMIFLPMACLLAATLIRQLGGRRVLTVVILALLPVVSMIKAAQGFIAPNPDMTPVAVQYVLDRAECGDTLIFGGQSISQVKYYLRRFDAPDCFRQETFPSFDTPLHPGWTYAAGLLSQKKEELVLEATNMAARLANQPGSTIWLFYANPKLTDLLKLELDRQLTFVQALDFEGEMLKSIMVYSTCSHSAVGHGSSYGSCKKS